MIDRLIFALILSSAVMIIFSTAIVQILLGLLTLAWIVKILSQRGYQYKRTSLDIPFLAFFVVRLVSIFVSTDVARSLPTLWTELPFYLLFFVLTQEFNINDAKQVKLFFRAMFVAAGVAAIIGSIYYLSGMTPRARSTTSGYYTLGNYLVLILAIVLFLGTTKEFIPNRATWTGICLVLATGILLTFNRLHWAAMAVLFAVVGVIRERKLLAMFIVGAAAFVILSPSATQRFSDLMNVASRSSYRDVIWRGAWMLADEHPLLGFGPRTFDAIFPLRAELGDKGVGSWHNDYIQVYMESGGIGLLAFLWLIGAALKSGLASLRNPALPAHLRELLQGLLAALVTIAVAGGMLDVLNSLVFRIILAMIALISSAALTQRVE